jgi:hypothetical protein
MSVEKKARSSSALIKCTFLPGDILRECASFLHQHDIAAIARCSRQMASIFSLRISDGCLFKPASFTSILRFIVELDLQPEQQIAIPLHKLSRLQRLRIRPAPKGSQMWGLFGSTDVLPPSLSHLVLDCKCRGTVQWLLDITALCRASLMSLRVPIDFDNHNWPVLNEKFSNLRRLAITSLSRFHTFMKAV